jgi:hypothetical protein
LENLKIERGGENREGASAGATLRPGRVAHRIRGTTFTDRVVTRAAQTQSLDI